MEEAGRPSVAGYDRPAEALFPVVACSFRRPVCVHAPEVVSSKTVGSALAAAEQALAMVEALALPPPLADGKLGGSPVFDLYVDPRAEPPVLRLDPGWPGAAFDEASAFAVVAPPTPGASCAFEGTIARAIGGAVAARLDPGAESGVVAMFATHLGALAVPCDPAVDDAVDRFQLEPERALTAGSSSEAWGAWLFSDFLDELGTGMPIGVLGGLVTVAGQRTAPAAWLWGDEPDVFDALRENLKTRGSRLDQLLLDFAVARAFVGSRSDGGHLPDVARFGDFGRVRIEWSVPYASLPRRLAPARPVEPTGATYVWVDLEGAPPDAELTLAADWDRGSLFRWSLVKIDATGAERGRSDLAGVYGNDHAEKTILGLGGSIGVLVVGTNVGSDDRSHPFDPDDTIVPSGCTVTLAK